jgi:hypothetical protein
MPRRLVFLITFDYELAIGRSFFSDEEVLFKPTEQLLDICDRLSCPVTFMPDVCSVWIHRKYGLNQYADRFEAQMKEAIERKHDVQLHLHPHWMASVYENGEWLISTDRMFLHEFEFDEKPDSAPALVKQGVQYLNNLLRPIKPEYECLAFRAAGTALQPREREILKALIDGGIRMDVSVTKNVTLNLDTVKIDYKNVPGQSFWKMAPETGPKIAAESGIWEIPIATFRSAINNRIGFLLRRARSINQMRGMTPSRSKHQSRLANLYTMVLQNLRYLTGNPWYILSCDTKGFNLEMLMDGLGDYISRHSSEETIYVTMMNHPKLMFDFQMKLMEDFVNKTRLKYDIQFVTCTEAYRQLEGNSR